MNNVYNLRNIAHTTIINITSVSKNSLTEMNSFSQAIVSPRYECNNVWMYLLVRTVLLLIFPWILNQEVL